ncbi:MAG: ThuA domain-containing protein [Verrucomicrobia bacterium]|nr:ThuA domain-containing protein [Verrucomicrobiota bacterium]
MIDKPWRLWNRLSCPIASVLLSALHLHAGAADPLVLNGRSRIPASDNSGRVEAFAARWEWDPAQTALVICDMWDRHWCQGASRRVAELAPAINEVARLARARGVLIIHAPSDVVDHYRDHPARQRALAAPKAASLPDGIDRWCRWINEEEKAAGYPIDDSDGGCDCDPPCPHGPPYPWRQQIDAIEIASVDAISASGAEIWNLLEQRGIRNVLLCGVHANMCVLGRPFGLRNLARFGKNAALIRDLTDTMYNSRRSPHVSHFTGTDLLIAHIERHVCPTVLSTDLTGRAPFVFGNDRRPRIVFISSENEYRAAETLPRFIGTLQLEHDLACELAQGQSGSARPNQAPVTGLESLARADLAVVFARRRALPADQMNCLRGYLARGRPLLGLRTASHAFDTRGNCPPGFAEWIEFDRDVLGGNYQGHHGAGPSVTVDIAPDARNHPILEGIESPFTSAGSLYRNTPLRAGSIPLLVGSIPGKHLEPVAWTHLRAGSRVFYTSLGHPSDFEKRSFQRLLINAIEWAMSRPEPLEVRPR